MNSRIVLLNLISIFLVFALFMAASAQTRTVGVNVGDTWRYSATASWSSTDPTATPPPHVVDYNDTQWLEVNITAISGTNITGQMTTNYKNGTKVSSGGWIDIDTGNNVNMTYMIISANLTVGDSLYTTSYATWFINETVPRTYLSGARDTNHINSTSSNEIQYLASNLYWDKSTGILVDLFVQNIYQELNYTTSWTEGLQIISSDLWVIPEFSTWTPALFIMIALTSATIIVSRQRGRSRTPYNQD